MNKIKLDYEAPEANTFVVRFEGNLLTGSPNSVNSTNRSEYIYGIDADPEEL